MATVRCPRVKTCGLGCTLRWGTFFFAIMYLIVDVAMMANFAASAHFIHSLLRQHGESPDRFSAIMYNVAFGTSCALLALSALMTIFDMLLFMGTIMISVMLVLMWSLVSIGRACVFPILSIMTIALINLAGAEKELHDRVLAGAVTIMVFSGFALYGSLIVFNYAVDLLEDIEGGDV